MAQDNFKYIIKTELQLNTGSINKLLTQVKEVDKQIKQHFDNNKNNGIRVPLSVNADITKLQGEVKRTIDGYNKSQAPHIKIPVSVDESSIRKLQSRISALKNELNSISNDKKTVSINTSLNVGAGEKAKVQKEVGGTKATMTVGLKLNEADIKAVKTQIESIKAEVKASVSAVQDHTRGMRRFGEQRNSQTANGGSQQQNNRSRQTSIQEAKRDYFDSFQQYQQRAKNLKEQIKGETELSRLRSELERAKKSKTKSGDMYGYKEDGSKFKVGANDYKQQLMKEIKEQETLARQLKRAMQATEIARQKMSQESFMTPQIQRSLTRIANNPTGQQKVSQQITKANYEKQMREAEQQKRDMERLHSHLADMGKRTSSYYDPNFDAKQGISKASAKRAMDERVAQAKQVQKLNEQMSNTAMGKATKLNANHPVTQLINQMQQAIKLQEKLSSVPTGKVSNLPKNHHVSQLLSQMEQARKMQEKLDSTPVGKATKLNPNHPVSQLVKQMEQAKNLGEKLSSIPTGKASNLSRNHPVSQLTRQIEQAIKLQEKLNNMPMGKASSLPKFHPARELARQNAEQQARQSLSANVNSGNNGLTARQQRSSDYNQGIIRYGGSKEYRGIDLEAQLRNPNVSLSDSLEILNKQIHPRNQAEAKANKQNFQRAYAINYRDDEGHIRSVRTLTYEYTSLGDKVERGDRSFKALAGNMLRNIGVYTLFTSGFRMMSQAIAQSIQDMINFDAQLAQVGMITQNLNTGAVSNTYKSFGRGSNEIRTAIQENAFDVGQKYGVSTMSTVLPVESQVLARTNLIKGKDGKIDPKMQKQMVDKIIQYSAVSTGGNASAEEVSAISQDVMSLYQAMYTQGETSHMGKIDRLLDYMAIMKGKGVNTNAVADAMSELAPDTIKKGIDPKLVAGMLGSYNLSDVDATGANMTQIGKLFFGSLAKPNNPTVKNALDKMDIDPSKEEYNTPKKLADAVMAKFPTLLQKDQAEVAEGLAGLTGKSSAMTPKMTKFLEAISSDYVNQFDKANKDTPNALEKSWDTFSNTLKRNFMELGEQVKELVQQLARLGLMDAIGLVVKGLTLFVSSINGVLGVVQKLSDVFSDNLPIFANLPKMAMELAGLMLAFKGLTTVVNKLTPGVGSAIGDWLQSKTGRRAGFKQIAGTVGGTVISGAPIPISTSRVAPKVATTVAQNGAIIASNMLPMIPVGTTNSRKVNSIPVLGGTPHPRVMNPNNAIMATNILGSMPILGGTPHPRVMPVGSRDVSTFYGRYGAQGIFRSNRIAMQQGLRELEDGPMPSRGTIIRGNISNASRSVASGGRKAIGSVGNFIGDALMIASFRNGGMRRAGAGVAERSGGALKAFGEWFKKMGPSFYRFGLILSRLFVIGSALATAWWVVNKVIDNAKKKADSDYKTQNKNLQENSKAMLGDKEISKKKNTEIDHFILDNIQFMKESKNASIMGTDMSTKAIERNKRISEGRKKFQDEYGLKFYSKGSGEDKEDFVKYHLLGKDGKMSKKEYTAKLGDKEQMDKFNAYRENGFRDESLEIKNQWETNLNYVLEYNDELLKTQEITKEIGRAMKLLGFNIENIDAKFFGVDSIASLKEKINATQQSLGGISDERAKMLDRKNAVEANVGSIKNDMSKYIDTAMKNGITQKQIDEVNLEYLKAKESGKTDEFLDNYQAPSDADIERWKKPKPKKGEKGDGLGLTDEQVQTKMNEAYILKGIAEFVMKLAGGTDALDSLTDISLQQEQAYRQQEYAIKQYTAQLLVASSGIGIMEAQISKINSAVGTGRAMVQMAEPNSKEQIGAQSSMIKVSSELLKGYRAELSSVTSKMNSIASQNPGQDFSLNYLYNPGEEGLTAQQSAYKELLEKQTSIQDSVSSTTVDVYEQAQQLKEMVLNSDKYADVWERVQNRTQLVKDANKEIFNMKNDMAMVDSLSQVRSAVTGQGVNEIRQSKLESIRDRGLDNYEQLMSALNTYGDDADKLNEAYNEINKTMGTEFDKAFISPLKDLIKNDFTEAGDKILKGADSLNTVLGNWAQFAMESASNPDSISGQTEAFNNAMKIPSYNGSGVTKDSPMDKKIDAYLEQMGYKKGTAGYVNARKQLVMSMSSKELETTVNNGLTETSNNASVSEYSKTIDGKLGGKLAGYGNTFTKYGAQYGIDPRLLAAIAMHETGNGTSKAVRDRNNVGGIMGSNGLKNFASLDEGIEALASLLKRLYFDQGLNTIPEIQRKYAPSGADNDPNGLNNYWQSGVSKYYSGMTGISQDALLGGQSINAGSGKGGSTAVSSSRGTVRRGSKGDDVKALQKALGISADGIFGSGTEKAVKKYQKSHGLDADGIVGNKTWSSLGLSSTSSTSSKSSSGNPLSMLAGMVGKSPSQGGLTYVWGGGHDSGDWDSFIKKAKADCSGFVQHFFREFGKYELGTGSSNMMWNDNKGKKVSKSELKEGDLIYFGSGGKVTHVGMYAGDGKMYNMTSSGQPLKLTSVNAHKDYVGAKRYDGVYENITANGTTSITKGEASHLDIVKAMIGSFIESMQAEADLKNPQFLKDAYYKDANMTYGAGNIRDPLGTSGRTAVADRVIQERETVYQKRYETVEQLKQLGTARKSNVELANKALKAGNKDEYKEYSNAVKAIDKLVETLTETNKKLGEWDKELNTKQLADPRINSVNGINYIRGGYDKLRSLSGEAGSPEYMRVANELNEMNSTYMTKRNKANILGQVWQNSGVGTGGYISAKRSADQEDINILFQKMSQINGVLNDFAEGTKAWYTVLEEAVAVQEELRALEEKRLANAQSMFELTGKGLDGYIQQKAYTTSSDRKRAKDNLSIAKSKLNSGEMGDTYRTQIGGSYSQKDAEKIKDKLHDKYGVEASLIYDKKTKKYTVTTESNLSKEKSEEIQKGIVKDKVGVKSASSKKVADGGKMDANEELATLQIIAGLQDQLMSGIEEYRSAVVGAFKAGALTLDEYLEKMNDLRDVQNEARENAIQLVDTLSSGIQEAFANALSGGMQGNMDSAQAFIDSVKQSIASAISSSLASSLLNNTGLLDLVNGFISKVTKAATTGNPDDIANMFNNEDFGTELQNMLAPFLPLIEEIVASTEGMFNIMKDQTFNAPEGYKIDQELYKVSKGKGVKDWDPTGKNGAGSPDAPTSGGGTVTTPPQKDKPSGPPSGTSGKGATGSPPGSTAPGGTGAPSTGSTTTTPKPDSTKVNTPKAPSKGGSSGHKHGTVNKGDTGADVKEIQKAVGVPQDGIFGPKTESAVKAFQKKHGLTADGIVGPKTWAEIHKTQSSSNDKGKKDDNKDDKKTTYKTTKTALNFRSSAKTGNNVISVLPKGTKVEYLGVKDGWAHVKYKGKTGYVGKSYIYHNGGIAGMMNFSSPNRLKPDEINAVLRQGEKVFTDKQVTSLVGGNSQTNNSSGGDINFNITVHVEGGQNSGALQASVETAVKKAIEGVKRDQRFTNLTWKGTSY
jgi:peptidoglycan hydrolase-like protein with peptidoglycan-binding domain